MHKAKNENGGVKNRYKVKTGMMKKNRPQGKNKKNYGARGKEHAQG